MPRVVRAAASALLGIALPLGLVGCSAPAGRTPVVAVATTTQLGSVVGDIVACAGGTSHTLMTPGLDPHEFSLSSAEVAGMERARLVVANGLGLEGGMASALANVVRDGGRVYDAAADVDPIDLSTIHADPNTGLAPVAVDDGVADPHFWMDAARMGRAAVNIGGRLADATGEARYGECGRTVGVRLQGVDAEVRAILAAVPAGKRILVTDHEAFNYFAAAYGFKVAGVVVPGGSSDADPSSADLRAVIDVIRSAGVKAIFSNTAVSPKLVQAVSADAGGSVRVVPLFVDSVGPPGSGAETYATMMLTDARAIASALGD
jgi:zinc/manganese transport system substrate-binding protein